VTEMGLHASKVPRATFLRPSSHRRIRAPLVLTITYVRTGPNWTATSPREGCRHDRSRSRAAPGTRRRGTPCGHGSLDARDEQVDTPANESRSGRLSRLDGSRCQPGISLEQPAGYRPIQGVGRHRAPRRRTAHGIQGGVWSDGPGIASWMSISCGPCRRRSRTRGGVNRLHAFLKARCPPLARSGRDSGPRGVIVPERLGRPWECWRGRQCHHVCNCRNSTGPSPFSGR